MNELRDKIAALKYGERITSPPTVVAFNEAIDDILALPSLQAVIEKAERMEKLEEHLINISFVVTAKEIQVLEWKDKASKYDNIKKKALVKKEGEGYCEDCFAPVEIEIHKAKYNKLFEGLVAVETVKASLVYYDVTPAGDTSAKAEQEIFRSLTDEEKEEVVEIMLKQGFFVLKSGVKVKANK